MTAPARLIAILVFLFAYLFIAPARAEEDPVPAARAYRVQGDSEDGARIALHFIIRDGYYLYADKFAVRTDAPGFTLGEIERPRGKMMDDPTFGTVETFHEDLTLTVPLTARPPGQQRLTVQVDLQGCWSGGICFPPETRSIDIPLPAADAPAATASPHAPPPAHPQSGIHAVLHDGSLPWLLASFFGFGLLLACTPCVFPMIPILSGIIAGHGHNISRARAGGLSALYVLGMALTYAAAGVLAGLSGAWLAAALQNAWVIGAFALLIVLLAVAMFSGYELQLPAAWRERLNARSQRLQGGQIGGVFLMGVFSALIVSPCVAAPLAGALLYIAQTRDAVRGALALFALACGMGAPLIVVGLLTRSLLPKSGAWMENVRHAFGFILLALAVWIARSVLPAGIPMLAWGLIAVFASVHLGAFTPVPPEASGWARSARAIPLLLLIYGVILITGWFAGNQDPLRPLNSLTAPHAATPYTGPDFTYVHSLAELNAQLAQHRDRPVMLDFSAEWCVSCAEMERYTFSDPQVAGVLESFVLLQVDVTANTAEHQALLKHFSLFGPPATLFFLHGEERPELRLQGFVPPEDFLPVLGRAHSTPAS